MLALIIRSMWYYQGKKDDSDVIDKLTPLDEYSLKQGFNEYFNKPIVKAINGFVTVI